MIHSGPTNCTMQNPESMLYELRKELNNKHHNAEYSHGFDGSLFTDTMRTYIDLNNLPFSFQEQTFNQCQSKIPGVTSSYFYIGSWATVAPLHCEDLYLWSLNIMLYGASKVWIIIPPSELQKVDSLLKGQFSVF